MPGMYAMQNLVSLEQLSVLHLVPDLDCKPFCPTDCFTNVRKSPFSDKGLRRTISVRSAGGRGRVIIGAIIGTAGAASEVSSSVSGGGEGGGASTSISKSSLQESALLRSSAQSCTCRTMLSHRLTSLGSLTRFFL